MAKRISISIRKAARIEGCATLRTTKTGLMPRLTNGLHLVIFISTKVVHLNEEREANNDQ